MRFEWDEAKAAINLNIHGVSFDEASEVFFDPNAIEGYDSEHSIGKTVLYYRIFKAAFALCRICRKTRRKHDSYNFRSQSRAQKTKRI
jgi:uncharacterized DUF497 family protein